MELLNRKGSVDDIRCSLGFITPKTEREIKLALAQVSSSHHDEQMNRKRTTVLSMLMTKYNKLIKQLQQWHQTEKSHSCAQTS
ncbi:MAG TPA: hypothetical protein PKH58_01490 [Paludibacteraceae bacterium]|nr:hypothetical protein [Paludibacteraceae bacterium]